MKKKILSFLIMLCIVTALLPTNITVFAAERSGDLYYQVETNGTITITGCYEYTKATEIAIPSEIDGKKVTNIGNWAFARIKTLEKITIPYGVTSIGEHGFEYCTNLTSITIPDSVETVGYSAFESCENIENISISGVKNIGAFAFCHCYKLKSINLSNALKEIGYHAFSCCTSLENISIPEYATGLGSAFYLCSSLSYISVSEKNTEYSSDDYGALYNKNKTDLIQYPVGNKRITFIIPDSVTKICSNAFEGGVNLINITIPSGVKQINSYAFLNCKSLSSITIPDSVTTIGQSAFGGCIDLTQITVSDKNTEFSSDNNGVLYNKNKTTLIKYPLGNESTSFVIPNSVNSIDNSAFSGCSNITSITIPNNITYIGGSAFYGTNLTDVYYNGTENDWNNIKISTNGNTSLTNATRTHFAYINISDKDGNKVIDTTQNMGEKVNVSSITVPENSVLKLYTDKDLTIPYSLDTPISENLNLYYDIIEINKLKITGAESADIGQKGITESVTFATDKTAKDFVATIKFSDKLNLSEITEKDFSITDNLSETKNGYTYLYLTCTYKNDENMPKNTTLNAFDLVFDVSESATANEKLTIEFVGDETFLADNDSKTYDFDGLGTAEIKVNPILVNSITINGADEIDKATQYTAVVSPENATNKDIEWAVDNSEIATISDDGTLTPVKAGTVKIKATAKGGNDVYAEKSVNVKVYATITSLSANAGVWNKEFTPTEREYIIYVPENTSSIKFTAQHSGTLKSETKTFYNGRTQTILLIDTETVLTLNYSELGYTDSEYKIKIVKFEGTKTTVSTDGKTFTIKPINIASGNTIILALYNGEEFVTMQSAVYSGKDIPFTVTDDYKTAKVMVWNNLDDIMPICDVEIVKYN